MTVDDLALLTSLKEIPRQLPSDLAAKMLVHFRPPLDDAEDPNDKALDLVTKASLIIRDIRAETDRHILGIEGVLEMRSAEKIKPTLNDKWSRIVKADLHVQGYIELSPQGELKDFHLLTKSATFVPPHGKEIYYEGVARLVKDKED